MVGPTGDFAHPACFHRIYLEEPELAATTSSVGLKKGYFRFLRLLSLWLFFFFFFFVSSL